MSKEQISDKKRARDARLLSEFVQNFGFAHLLYNAFCDERGNFWNKQAETEIKLRLCFCVDGSIAAFPGERADGRAAGAAKHLFGRAILRDEAVFHINHAIRHVAGEVHFVGDDDHRALFGG